MPSITIFEIQTVESKETGKTEKTDAVLLQMSSVDDVNIKIGRAVLGHGDSTSTCVVL